MQVRRWLALAMASAAGCSCFVRGTRVHTARGPRPIEELREGDKVWSWSFVSARPVERAVSATLRATAPGVIELRAGELVIPGVSRSHPIWSPRQQRWQPAGELAIGDVVLAWLGADEAREIRVDAVVEREGEVEVFNLTVEGEHNYFAEGVLVHNKSPEPNETAICDTSAVEICDDEIDNDCDALIDLEDEGCAR